MQAKLEKATATFIESLAGTTPIYQRTPEQARAVLEKVQSAPVAKKDVHIDEITIAHDTQGEIVLRIMKPQDVSGPLPVVVYFHGAGWVMGSAHTHDYLMRELAVASGAAVVFVQYALSPEAHFPVAIEQAYAATHYIHAHAAQYNLDASCFAVAGDSVGGNMAIAVTLLAAQRGGPHINFQLLFYPVTDAGMNTLSYEQFAQGPWLTKPSMEWFWNAYAPESATRTNILMSPLRASDEQLRGLPSALIITAENDVLRDEGEAYAHKLMNAGVTVTAVRFLGTIHDFMMLHPLVDTPAARAAIALASNSLRTVFKNA